LVSVTVRNGLQVPIAWVAKAKEVGERLTTGPPLDETPVPVRLAVWGLFEALKPT
jgi:hypothetical protein